MKRMFIATSILLVAAITDIASFHPAVWWALLPIGPPGPKGGVLGIKREGACSEPLYSRVKLRT